MIQNFQIVLFLHFSDIYLSIKYSILGLNILTWFLFPVEEFILCVTQVACTVKTLTVVIMPPPCCPATFECFSKQACNLIYEQGTVMLLGLLWNSQAEEIVPQDERHVT